MQPLTCQHAGRKFVARIPGPRIRQDRALNIAYLRSRVEWIGRYKRRPWNWRRTRYFDDSNRDAINATPREGYDESVFNNSIHYHSHADRCVDSCRSRRRIHHRRHVEHGGCSPVLNATGLRGARSLRTERACMRPLCHADDNELSSHGGCAPFSCTPFSCTTAGGCLSTRLCGPAFLRGSSTCDLLHPGLCSGSRRAAVRDRLFARHRARTEGLQTTGGGSHERLRSLAAGS